MEEQKSILNNLPKCPDNSVKTILAIIITALFVGGGVYFWQQSTMEKVKNETKQKIDSLETQNSSLNTLASDLNNQIKELQNQISNIPIVTVGEENKSVTSGDLQEQVNKKITELRKDNYIELISPKGGEVLCLGENFVIEWKHNGITSQVWIDVLGVKKQQIASVDPNLNETGEYGEGMYVWKIGSLAGGRQLEPDNAYTLEISGSTHVDDPTPIGLGFGDKTDTTFTIIRCEG